MTPKTKQMREDIIRCIEATLDAKWEAAGRKPDTTLEEEAKKGRHWLLEESPSRPSISTFLRTVLKHMKWSQTDMGKRVGMNVCNLNRLVTGGQQSCAPETKAKFGRLVENVPALSALFHSTDWGLSAEPNRVLAQEKKRRQSSVRR